VSSESLALLDQAWRDYPATGNAAPLVSAAIQHLSSSRPLDDVLADYTAALDSGDTAAAQAYADELEPLRTAQRITEGHLPAGPGAGHGME
jgi:hypothetical protein